MTPVAAAVGIIIRPLPLFPRDDVMRRDEGFPCVGGAQQSEVSHEYEDEAACARRHCRGAHLGGLRPRLRPLLRLRRPPRDPPESPRHHPDRPRPPPPPPRCHPLPPPLPAPPAP